LHKKNHSMKWFALLGLILFLGVAVAPGINALISEDAEIYDLTIEINGLGSYTVRMDCNDAIALDAVIDSLKRNLDASDNIEDAITEINKFNDEFNHLANISYPSEEIVERLIVDIGNKQSNFGLYVVGGETSSTAVYGPGISILNQIIESFSNKYIKNFHMLFLFLYNTLGSYRSLNICGLGQTICIGRYIVDEISGNKYKPGTGWVTSFGPQGKQNWSSPMYGNLSLHRFEWGFGPGYTSDYPAIRNFFGLKIQRDWIKPNWFYLGIATKVDIFSP